MDLSAMLLIREGETLPMRFTTRILLLTLAIELVGYASLVLFNRASSEEALRGAREEHLEAIVEGGLDSINGHTRIIEHSVLSLAAEGEQFLRVQSENRTYDAQPALQDYFATHFRELPEALGGGLWYEPFTFRPDLERCGLSVHRVSGEMVFTWNLNTEEYNYPKQDWYLLGLPAGWDRSVARDQSVYWTAPYVDEAGSKSLMVTADAFIYDQDGEIAGLSTVDWSLKDITAFVQDLQITERSRAFLIDPSSGKFLAENGSDPLRSTEDTGLASRLDLNKHSGHFSQLMEVQAGGVDSRVYYARTDAGMIFGVLIPERDFFDSARKVSQANFTIGVGIAFVAVACVFTLLLLFIRGLRRVLALLRVSVKDDDVKGDVPVEPISYPANDEFQPMVAAFNEISQRIHHAHDRLRSESKEREALQDELDFTQRKLIRAQKLESVGRLAGSVAHDFNNIITVILGHAELAALGTASGDSIVQDLQEIEKAGQRAEELTRQILSFSSRHETTLRPLNMNALIRDVWNMLGQLSANAASLEMELQDELGLTLLSVGQFDQILANLVVNSSDSMSSRGTIKISTASVVLSESVSFSNGGLSQGAYVVLRVSDSGSGMPPEVKEKIFEPFFTTKPQGEGTGIGLATVAEIVLQLSGAIDVTSQVGEGSTFALYFPASDANALPVELPVVQVVPAKSRAILVVDDDQLVLAVEVRALRSAGYTVHVAQSGAAALAVLEAHPETSLLISDVLMPDMSSTMLAELASESLPRLRFLFVSGYTAGVLGRLSEKQNFLPKPFTPGELMAAVQLIFKEDSAATEVAVL